MNDQAVRDHVLYLLNGGGAHVDFEGAIHGWPPEWQGKKVPGSPHTAWRLLEHMRICQWDILEFSRNPQHVSPAFPDGYWPPDDEPSSTAAWNQSVEQFRRDLRAMKQLVADPAVDLLAPISHGDGQTILREALLVADHNAYHLGQLMFLRRCLQGSSFGQPGGARAPQRHSAPIDEP
ncbi:MAG: hypothetical protein KatS3mg111_0318 [Pirellulaceae bacterium]|nr:MAG: hypothetical protein KatS3mg111_0318 [Pirellulaceae bacterium]